VYKNDAGRAGGTTTTGDQERACLTLILAHALRTLPQCRGIDILPAGATNRRERRQPVRNAALHAAGFMPYIVQNEFQVLDAVFEYSKLISMLLKEVCISCPDFAAPYHATCSTEF